MINERVEREQKENDVKKKDIKIKGERETHTEGERGKRLKEE